MTTHSSLPAQLWWQAAAIAALVAALLLAPALLASQHVATLTSILITALFTLSFGLLVGQGGMLSFGHSAYFAIGAFATLHVMRGAEAGSGFPTPFMPLAGAAAALLAGAVFGFFATLRRGVYFSMVTLAIAELLHTLAPNLQGMFGGESGLSSMRMPWAGIGFGTEREVYYLVLGWVLLCTLAMVLYTRTSFGRVTVALRENERRLAFLGFNVHRSKVLVFAVSSMFAGTAGGLLALANESANYTLFNLSNSASVVLYTYIGGAGPFIGPAIGAVVMTLFGHAVSELTRQWLLYQGLIFVLMMMYAPTGLTGLAIEQASRIRHAGARDNLRRLAMAGAMAVIAIAGVFLCELGAAAFATAYQAQVQRTGVWESVRIFGQVWAPGQAGTWGVPALILVAFAMLLGKLAASRGANADDAPAESAVPVPGPAVLVASGTKTTAQART
jgi:branched-chain amino acid transport system permease protein